MADDAARDQNPAIAVEAAPADAAPAVAAPLAAVSAVASAVGTPGGPATGTVTPALSEMPPEQVEHSLRVSLADLCARAAAQYTLRDYETAAELYSRATEMQAEINGEMSPENAEILFLYGRTLFKVGQSKSDVLGGKAPENNKAEASGKKASKKGVNGSSAAGAAAAALDKKVKEGAAEDETPAQRIAEEGVAIVAAETSTGKEETAALEAKKPLFQFTGDENWDDSDGEEVKHHSLSFCNSVAAMLTKRIPRPLKARRRVGRARKKKRKTISLSPSRSSTWPACSSARA
jgi:HAT1-interacting factor 1